MTGIKAVSVVALVSGPSAGMLALLDVDPQSLKGLDAAVLMTLITFSALGVLVYFIRTLASEMRAATKEQIRSNSYMLEMCAKLNTMKCIADKDGAAKEAHEVIDEAASRAHSVLAEAEKRALDVIAAAAEKAKKP